MRLIHLVPIFPLTFQTFASAFSARSTHRTSFSLRLSSVEDPIESSSKVRRRRRKDSQSVEDEVDRKPEAFQSVQQEQAKSFSVQVSDIREIVSGSSEVSRYTSTNVDIEPEGDNDMKSMKSLVQVSETQSRVTSGKGNDSLERLLSDARKMREERKGDTSVQVEGPKRAIVNALSTLVTVDFFIVCGFLLWFLLGVFFSYVIKDDTVQIAFNGIFQPLVQPALGILMIGSAMGAVLKEKSED